MVKQHGGLNHRRLPTESRVGGRATRNHLALTTIE
jgi:hypothetical protein